MKKVILCIFGSRKLPNISAAVEAIEQGLIDLGIKTDDIRYVLSGGADGADTLGEDWAFEAEIVCRVDRARWDEIDVEGAVIKQGKYGPYNSVAGFWRNQRMAERATHFIALRKKGRSSGTDDMIRRVQSLNKPLSIHLL